MRTLCYEHQSTRRSVIVIATILVRMLHYCFFGPPLTHLDLFLLLYLILLALVVNDVDGYLTPNSFNPMPGLIKDNEN